MRVTSRTNRFIRGLGRSSSNEGLRPGGARDDDHPSYLLEGSAPSSAYVFFRYLVGQSRASSAFFGRSLATGGSELHSSFKDYNDAHGS